MPPGRGEEWLAVEPQAAVCQDCLLLSPEPVLQKDSEGTVLLLFSLILVHSLPLFCAPLSVSLALHYTAPLTCTPHKHAPPEY